MYHNPVTHLLLPAYNLSRWNSRINSLIAPSSPAQVRQAGFKLLNLTFKASQQSLLNNGKNAISQAQAVVQSPKSDHLLFVAALDLLVHVLAASTWHPEWARDNVGASFVQKTVQYLINTANNENTPQLRKPSVEAIVSLLPLTPTPLRPLNPSLHTLAISLICKGDYENSSTSRPPVELGALLFAALYVLAPKGKEGLQEAWKTGAFALVGSMDSLVTQITSDIFAEDPLQNHALTPLALPPLPSYTPLAALNRLESLSRVLTLVLRTPTSERTGQVDVPAGAIAELGTRLVGLCTETPIKDRVDPTVVTLTLSLLPRVQVVGCHLLAQLGLCIGPQLAANAPEILGALSRTVSTYPVRSPMRPALSTTYALLVEAMGAAIDPDEGRKSLARVWRTVLEDIGAVAVEPVSAAPSGVDAKSRKNKRQKTYDPTESMNLGGRRMKLDSLDLYSAERGLATLSRLLHTPHSHFLPPKLHVATARLVLALALDPAFFSAHTSSAQDPALYPATCAARGIDIARESAEFRRGVLQVLRALLETDASEGLVDRATEVWKRASTDLDPEIRALATSALTTFSSLAHPTIPPLQVNSTLAREKQARLGGTVGDDIDIEDGAAEFAVADEEVENAKDGDFNEMKVDELAPNGTATLPAPAPPPPVVPPPSFTKTFSSGFGFKPSTPAVVVPTPAALEDVLAPAPVIPSFTVEISKKTEEVTTTISDSQGLAAGQVKRPFSTAGLGGDEDDDSDDDALPTIVMDSDDE
ncbi:hypothetical protein T439DRAFT_357288 [Meredithblackwellia eburnea MCA 4105]